MAQVNADALFGAHDSWGTHASPLFIILDTKAVMNKGFHLYEEVDYEAFAEFGSEIHFQNS
jgi:hypothetical protein